MQMSSLVSETWACQNLSLHVQCVVLVNRVRCSLLIRWSRPKCSSIVLKGISEPSPHAPYALESNEQGVCRGEVCKVCPRTDRWQGWPSKSSQSIPCSESQATQFCLKSPRNACIWAIYRHHRRRCEARRRVAASSLVASQQHRMKAAHLEVHLL